MTRLLIRLLVTPFYRRHLGVLAALFVGAVAVVQASTLVAYHAAIMRALLSSWTALAVLATSWASWTVRALRQSIRFMRSDEGRFLYGLRGISTRVQQRSFAIVVLLWILPVLAYACLLSGYAFRLALPAKAIFVLCVPLAAGWLALRRLTYIINVITKDGMVAKRRSHGRVLPFALWPAVHFQKTEGRGFLVVKAFSLLLLYIPFVWNRDRYDHDSLPLFLIALNAANSWLAWRCVRFVEGPLRFYRNLPLPRARVFRIYALSFALLLVPEAVYLAWATRGLLVPVDALLIWLAPFSLLLFLSSVQYGNGTARDEFGKVLGGLSFVSLFFFNGEWYGRWAVILVALAVFLYFYNWRIYEEAENMGTRISQN